MSASNYLEDKILGHVFGGVSYTAPATWYIKMHTGDPGENCTSNAAGETTRKAITFGTVSSGSIAATGSPNASWTSVASTETWTHFSLWDASSGGNPGVYGALSASRSVTAGDDVDLTSFSISQD
jgi:hypothetical protein